MKLLDRYTNRKAANGTLYLTATHLIYVDASAEVRKETWVCCDTGSLFKHECKNDFVILYQKWTVVNSKVVVVFYSILIANA